MFRLLRNFSIASLVSMVLAAIVLAVLHQLFEKHHILESGESQNVALVQAFSSASWPQFRSLADSASLLDADALRHHPDIAKLSQSVRDAVRNTPTVKVTIQQLDGRTLFSSDALQIGTNDSGNPGFISARQGVARSEITRYKRFNDSGEELMNRDVLSSSIPLRSNADGPIDAVMSIYTDITALQASAEKEGRLFTLSVVVVLAALYGILLFIARRIDSVIRRQSEQRRLTEERLLHLATHDALTDLPNRNLLLDRIKQSLTSAERRSSLLAVALIDLDKFRNINISMGHAIGDKVLQTVAQRLTRCLRENDTIARLGNDEFVVSLPDIHSSVNLFQVAQKILGAISMPMEAAGLELHLTASIGIALYPEHGKDAETLMRKADLAMQSAQRLGSNRHQMFVEQMSERVQQQTRFEDEMWRALENNEFALYYQPIVDLASGAIVGAEALLRWPNVHGEERSMAELIPLTERCGLIVPLSEWIVSEACMQLQSWREGGYELGHLTMAVNLSARHFATAGLATMIAEVIEQAEINPGALHLEISDSLLAGNDESVLTNFEGLKRVGIKFSLDDFGTGFSSLGYLRRYPIDTLKIPCAFVQNLPGDADNVAIVTTIIALANSLELAVVAKGVETDAQLSCLQHLGCHLAQGFLFSRPLPPDEFLSLVLEQRDMNTMQAMAWLHTFE